MLCGGFCHCVATSRKKIGSVKREWEWHQLFNEIEAQNEKLKGREMLCQASFITVQYHKSQSVKNSTPSDQCEIKIPQQNSNWKTISSLILIENKKKLIKIQRVHKRHNHCCTLLFLCKRSNSYKWHPTWLQRSITVLNLAPSQAPPSVLTHTHKLMIFS